MSVHEMGDMLGLKKTDRYWLVHKNYFRTETLLGKMRVEIASFEKWYANQDWYHKVNISYTVALSVPSISCISFGE